MTIHLLTAIEGCGAAKNEKPFRGPDLRIRGEDMA